ncbi:MAG TPA: DUF3047 domain-containing protein, partial [Salinibacter sp.]|nr:DUF3047 domain-containing protein [Salinibacter sp.]
MTATRFSTLLGTTILVLILIGLTGSALRIGHFSAQSPSREVPEGWKEIRFGENESGTRYNLVRRDSTVVVRARSQNGASGFITLQRVDLARYPILEWRW